MLFTCLFINRNTSKMTTSKSCYFEDKIDVYVDTGKHKAGKHGSLTYMCFL